MSNNNIELEREELHRKIWAIANDLRGSIDGWDFKQYILGMLFYRYISEHLTEYINNNEHDAGNKDFNYADLSDDEASTVRDYCIDRKGFYIPPSELFENIRKKINSSNDNEKAIHLNEELDRIFKDIEASAKGTKSEDKLSGLFYDIDVNSNKLGASVRQRNELLKKLINGISDMELGTIKSRAIDTFGDAYEYLMAMYASSAGKSGGEFFTPQHVSELLTKITLIDHKNEFKKSVKKVYDPACGSGSLLLNFAKILGKDNVDYGFYGQEINLTTYNLCRINMFLHDIDYDKFFIDHGDTLTDPKNLKKESFEAIVSNPPYSIKWEGNDNPVLINDERFSPAGVLAPKSKADFSFIMHSLYCLDVDGVAAIVCFPGIMYRGGAEQKIRQYLVEHNFIECIIQLPDNLFFGTQIATCIMVLKKSKLDGNTLFIDASKDFEKATNNNKLSSKNIEDILTYYKNRETKEYKSYLATKEEIIAQDYNLSVSTYVEAEDTREIINIEELNKELEAIVLEENKLREEIESIIKEIEG